MNKNSKEKKLFIVHWQYHKYGDGYEAPHSYINRKELFESDNVSDFQKHLEWICRERKLQWDCIKSIEQVIKTESVNFKNLIDS